VPTIRLNETIAAPVSSVFAAFSDFENAAERVKEIVRVELLTPGPVGVGTKFKETRVMFGREATETMTVTAFEPDRLIELTAGSCGAEFRSRFTFAPNGSGTAVAFEMQTRAVSLLAKLMTPLAYLMVGTIRNCVRRDMEQIRQSLEADAARGA
jgi:hypothetical protein